MTSSPRRRRRNDVATAFTGAQCLVTAKFFIDLAHGVGPVVADFHRGLVDLCAAFPAEPFKVIDLTSAALALKDDEPGLRFEARRMGHAGRAQQNLTGFDLRGMLCARFIPVN